MYLYMLLENGYILYICYMQVLLQNISVLYKKIVYRLYIDRKVIIELVFIFMLVIDVDIVLDNIKSIYFRVFIYL